MPGTILQISKVKHDSLLHGLCGTAQGLKCFYLGRDLAKDGDKTGAKWSWNKLLNCVCKCADIQLHAVYAACLSQEVCGLK